MIYIKLNLLHLLPIIGASKPQHLDDAVAALTLQLEPTEIARLEEPYVPGVVVGHS
jgi:aryl-alcohol dehydrogenase-like predicted oxidoreductase